MNEPAPAMRMENPGLKLAQPWMFEEERAHYAAAAPDDLRTEFQLQIGDRPFVRDVRKLYELYQRPVPPELEVLAGDLYLVTHAVGLVSPNRASKVQILGYRATFSEHGSTVELLPNTAFREYFKLDVNAGFEAGLTAEGHAKLPDQLGALENTFIDLGVGASLQLGAKANAQVLGKLSLPLSLKTPKIQAVGQASSTLIWQFHKADNPLVGTQIMVQTLLVPAGQEVVTFTMQAFAQVREGLFSATRVETPEKTVGVRLKG
jgi:hypothetical protein